MTREEKKNDKKESIVNSIKTLILKNGYLKTTVEDITDNIKISKGSFYTYFPSKEDLLNSMLEDILKDSKNRKKEILSKEWTLEEAILYNVKLRFAVNETKIKTTLVILSLSYNFEKLSLKIRKKLMAIRNENVETWLKIIKNEFGVGECEKKEKYAILIEEILFFYLKKNIYNSELEEEIGLYTKDLDLVYKRGNSKNIEKEIEFIYKIILNILKGER
ncbi:MAG: TetR/AcrR family transcriptional regulator [Fusobacteriaceae bacterium]